MSKFPDLTASSPCPGSSVVTPLSYNGVDGGKKATMGLCTGLLCTSKRVIFSLLKYKWMSLKIKKRKHLFL